MIKLVFNNLITLAFGSVFLISCASPPIQRNVANTEENIFFGGRWVITGEKLAALQEMPRPLEYPLINIKSKIEKRINAVHKSIPTNESYDAGASQPKANEIAEEISLLANCFGFDPLLFSLVIESQSEGYHTGVKPIKFGGYGLGAVTTSGLRMVGGQLFHDSDQAVVLGQQISCYLQKSERVAKSQIFTNLDEYKDWLKDLVSGRGDRRQLTRSFKTSLLTGAAGLKIMLAVSKGNYISGWRRWYGGPISYTPMSDGPNCDGSETNYFSDARFCSLADLVKGVVYFFESPEERNAFLDADHLIFKRSYIRAANSR